MFYKKFQKLKTFKEITKNIKNGIKKPDQIKHFKNRV